MHAAWISKSKSSGSGNDSVIISANSDNTGRNARSTQLTFKAANVSDVIRPVSQPGKPEFVTIQSAASVSKSGASALTISGKSNSSKLTFSLGSSPSLALTLPTQYVANSINVNNGAAITGDPGASAEYNFSIAFTNIPENTTIESLVAQLIVTDNAGNTATCTITQAAGDAYLEVSPNTIELPWNAYSEGITATASVTSNTTWDIE